MKHGVLVVVLASAGCIPGWGAEDPQPPHHNGDAGAGDGRDRDDDAGDGGVDPDAPACVKRTCVAPVLACNDVGDGCGGTLHCGGCESPLICGIDTPDTCGIAEADRSCTNGWCWQNPVPSGTGLTAVWGSSLSDVWITGAAGTLRHDTGGGFAPVPSGTTSDLSAVWGTSPSNAWIAGTHFVRRWNGSALVITPGAPTDTYVNAIHGTSATDVHMVSDFGSAQMWHWNGATWTGTANKQFFPGEDVFALSPALAYTFGFSDTAQQWNGSTWSILANGPQDSYSIWGSSATDVWVGGFGIHHWDGTAWTAPTGPSYVYALAGTSSTNVWGGGEGGLSHYDGTAWTTAQTLDATIRKIWLAPGGGGWAVGDAGRLFSFDGTTWHQRGGFGRPYVINAMCAPGDHDALAFGGGVLHWHDGTVEDLGTTDQFEHTSAWCASTTDAWTTGSKLQHWDGAHWQVATTPVSAATTGVFGLSSTDVYAVTRGFTSGSQSGAAVLHWDGNAWTQIWLYQRGSTGGGVVGLTAVAASSDHDIWVAAADNGTVVHFDGTQWLERDLPGGVSSVDALWVSPAGVAYAAGFYGTYRWSGTDWTQLTTASATSLAGTSDTDVSWLVDATVFHYDGTTVTSEAVATGTQLRALAVSAHGLWLGGTSGAILRKPR